MNKRYDNYTHEPQHQNTSPQGLQTGQDQNSLLIKIYIKSRYTLFTLNFWTDTLTCNHICMGESSKFPKPWTFETPIVDLQYAH